MRRRRLDAFRGAPPYPGKERALLEDRLAQAGLDVFAHRPRPHYDAVGDDDPVF